MELNTNPNTKQSKYYKQNHIMDGHDKGLVVYRPE